MNKQWTLGTAAGLILLILAAWALGWFDGKDPAMAELEKLRDEGFERHEQMSESERDASREQFGERMRTLSEEQRQTFFENSAPIFMKMFETRIDRFLEMPPEQQNEEMDKRIDEMQKRGNGPPPDAGNRPPPNPEQIDEFRKKMLDWTTPEQRAKFENAMQMFNERLRERGMNPMPGGGFF